MHLFIYSSLFVFLLLHVEALPNVFEYEIEKAKEFVQTFEVNKDQKVKLEAFSWTDCSSSAPIVSVKSLSIQPDPIVFPGSIEVQTDFSLKSGIDTPLKAELKIEKEFLGRYITVPCIDGFGSCTYDDVCQLLSQIQQCPDALVKAGFTCSCPIKQNSYSIPRTEFAIPTAFVPSGDYRIRADLTHQGGEVVCLELILTVE